MVTAYDALTEARPYVVLNSPMHCTCRVEVKHSVTLLPTVGHCHALNPCFSTCCERRFGNEMRRRLIGDHCHVRFPDIALSRSTGASRVTTFCGTTASPYRIETRNRWILLRQTSSCGTTQPTLKDDGAQHAAEPPHATSSCHKKTAVAVLKNS